MKSVKTKEELLKSYMRRNKVARERMAQLAGFNTGDEFKAHLKLGIEKDKGKTDSKSQSKKGNDIIDTIHNVYIIDRSGSMGSNQPHRKLGKVIIGVNSEMSELRKDVEFKYLQTIVQFDDNIKTVVNKKPIDKVDDYMTQAGGVTALNQAVGETLKNLIDKVKPNEKTIVKIFTDGGENASKGLYSDSKKVKEIINIAEEHGITVAFVGAQNEVNYAIRRFGIKSSNTLVHENTAESVKMSFKTSTNATVAYSNKVSKGEAVLDGFYKETGKLD